MEQDLSSDFAAYLEKEKTLAWMMLSRAEAFGDLPALRYVEDGAWKQLSWKRFGEQIRAIAKALLEEGFQPGEMIAIFSKNRPEWAVVDLGVLAVRCVSVPIYATNSAAEAGYIVADAGVRMVFVGDQEQYDKAVLVMETAACLQRIVALDRHIRTSGERSVYFDEMLERGGTSGKAAELENRLASVDSEDMLTLIYTSGTTGAPKGAVHTHRSFLAGIFPSVCRFPDNGPGDVSLAILPLSHVFERMWSYGCMSTGVEIAYCPDPKQFLEVMTAVRPHCMTSVPRIWEKVYGTINEGLLQASPLKRKLFYWARDQGLQVYRDRLSGRKTGGWRRIKFLLAETLVIRKLREKLGCDRNQVYHIGGAPFAAEVNEFFQAFGINVIQGYGLTEFFPVCVGFGNHGRPGACGPVLPMVDVRISNEGEIQLRGQMAMKSYYNKPAETAESITDDGWFCTGDIGRIEGDELKYIFITDRLKDIIITSGGKNISPQQIEVLLGDELFIEQVVVIGDGRKFISALIVPNFETLEAWAREKGIRWSSRAELIRNPDVTALYEQKVARRTRSLGQVEKIKKIKLLVTELTQDRGELTPTMKIRRKVVDRNYQEMIEKIYAEQ